MRAMSTAPAALEAAVPSRYGAIIFLMGLCQLVLTTDFSLVSVALPSIGRAFHAEPGLLSWVVSATALTFAGFLIVGGRLSDLVGRRHCLVAGLLIFGFGSICAAGSTSLFMLTPSRALLGLGAALLSPASFSLVTTLVPEGPPRHRALGVFGMMQGVSVIIGLVIGGLLTTRFGWRFVFLLNIPFILAALALTLRLVPQSAPVGKSSLSSFLSAILLTIAVAMLLLSFSLIGEMRSGSRLVLVTLPLAVLAFLAFALLESRSREPLVPRAVYTRRMIAGCVAGAALLAGVAGVFLLVNLYMQTVLQYSAEQSGIGMLPYALTVIAAGQLTPLVLARLWMRHAAIMGFAVNVIGLLIFAATVSTLSYPAAILAASLVTPLGSLTAFMALAGDALSDVPEQHQGLASAGLFTCQQLGLALGGTVCLSVITASHGAGVLAFTWGYWAAAAMTLAGLLFFLAWRRAAN